MFKSIANECREFVSIAEDTFSLVKLDMATIIISTSYEPFTSFLPLQVNGVSVNL